MSEKVNDLECRRYLDAAKFHLSKMESNLQNRREFNNFLLAFLSIARSITLVFQKEIGDNSSLQSWYLKRTDEWKKDKIMRFFIFLRNTSVKEHLPNMKMTAVVSFAVDAVLVDKVHVEKISPNETSEKGELSPQEPIVPINQKEQASTKPTIIGYSFLEIPEEFNESSDVMYLCKKYFDELETFVTEVEKLMLGL